MVTAHVTYVCVPLATGFPNTCTANVTFNLGGFPCRRLAGNQTIGIGMTTSKVQDLRRQHCLTDVQKIAEKDLLVLINI